MITRSRSNSVVVRRPFQSRVGALILAFSVLGLGGMVGCGPGEESEQSEDGDGAVENGAAVEVASGTSGTDWVGGVILGSDIDADGRVVSHLATDRFELGELVYLSVMVTEPPANAEVRVVFQDSTGSVLAEDAKKVPVGASNLWFSTGPTGEWALGTYRAEIRVDGERVAEAPFQLVEAG